MDRSLKSHKLQKNYYQILKPEFAWMDSETARSVTPLIFFCLKGNVCNSYPMAVPITVFWKEVVTCLLMFTGS